MVAVCPKEITQHITRSLGCLKLEEGTNVDLYFSYWEFGVSEIMGMHVKEFIKN